MQNNNNNKIIGEKIPTSSSSTSPNNKITTTPHINSIYPPSVKPSISNNSNNDNIIKENQETNNNELKENNSKNNNFSNNNNNNELEKESKLKEKLNGINNLPQPKRDELYWCWTLKEYIRLGHIKSLFRILKIIEFQSPYFYINDFLLESPKTQPSSNNNSNNSTKFVYQFNSKPVLDKRRLSFPYLYIPNLLRQRSDLLQCFNKSLSISNILYTLSSGNIDSLVLPNYLPIPKSLPIVPYLLIIVYFKLCLSKGENARSIIDSLLECRQKIHMLPSYEYSDLPPVEILLDNIMHVTLRFIDWNYENPMKLIPTEVYFNEVFEVVYLNGRDFLTSSSGSQQIQPQQQQPPQLTAEQQRIQIIQQLQKSQAKISQQQLQQLQQLTPQQQIQQLQSLQQQQQKIQQQQQQQQQQTPPNTPMAPMVKQERLQKNLLNNGSILSMLTIPSDEQKFKMIDIYLADSRKIVFLNIGSLASIQKRGNIKLSTWSEENINTLINCCRFYLDIISNNIKGSVGVQINGGRPQANIEASTQDDTMTILDCCMRLAFSWATICSGILPNTSEKYTDLESCWWNIEPERLQSVLRDWIGVIKRILIEIKTPNSDKLHLVCLVWLASTISLFDEDDEQYKIQQQSQQQPPFQHPNQLQLDTSYSLYIKTIKMYPDLLNEFTKSSLIITSLGFALIGVQTLEQTSELIQILVTLWEKHSQIPSIENACLVFKTIQNVINTKFKQENFSNIEELTMALIAWIRCLSDEIYSLFYSSNTNSRFLCMFIGSSLIHSIKRNKRSSLIPEYEKKEVIGKIQELFYTLVNQHTFLLKPFKIGLATAYSLSSIDPFTDKQANQSILMIVLEVLLDEILLINSSLVNWLEKPNEINAVIIKKIESHKTTPLFLGIPPFIQTISSLVNNLRDNDNNKLVLLKLCDFTYALNEKWTNYVNEISPPIPKSMLRKALDPTFQAIFQSLSLLFFEISPALTPMDSVTGIDLFCKLTFLSTDEEIQTINKAVRALAKNVLTSECAIIRVIDKMPLYYQVLKDDRVAILQVVLYLHALDILIPGVPHNLIVEHIVPNIFEYMEYPNSRLNSLSHSVLAKIFMIPNFHLSIKMVPMYLRTALKTFPKFTKVSSLYEVLVAIIESNPPTNPIVLYSIKTIVQNTIEHMNHTDGLLESNNRINNNNDNNNNNNNNNTTKNSNIGNINHSFKKQKDINPTNNQSLNNSAKSLIKLLYSLFLYLDIQIIDLVLAEIKKVIIKAPNQKIRFELCQELLTEFTGNLENNTKKNMCVSWYLDLIKEVENLNSKPNLAPSDI
ncbi:hypothetical protein DICPUDRAFT_99174 [Dictyostelium purpureum]|uniref:Uncharacterized protein n=1 Tax=Dictyostelium purpureum TaxID=5786 RepID=F0ZWV0_DICPU|nr:uncharacterized protein DICPUDRAFT_99174 [Dictyostelium purpureum]EGC31578.1 hypothetical protein DICPUDRAFT_99174 [Dictyostelium purpureum]|eukprot:XP_003291889.1 hypothetical protein DICPUDRAFT_99174 [Dictyostelium purpureum]